MIINSKTGAVTATLPDTPEKAAQRLIDLAEYNKLLLEDTCAEHVCNRAAAWEDDISILVGGPVRGNASVWAVLGSLIDALEAATPEAERTAELTRLIASKALIEDTYPKPIT